MIRKAGIITVLLIASIPWSSTVATQSTPQVGDEQFRAVRRYVARRYLKGEGIEIGALHNPLPVPPDVHVKYLDRLTVSELRIQYPQLSAYEFVPVDIVDDGERLAKVQDATQDFVIANHFLEHCENPLMTMDNMIRVLKPEGILYMAIPDKRYTFDVDRPITPFEHIMRDFKEGPGWSRKAHFEEYTRLVDKVQGEDKVRERMNKLLKMNYSIHFHVWTQNEMIEIVLYQKKRTPFEIEMMTRNGIEVIFVLRKS